MITYESYGNSIEAQTSDKKLPEKVDSISVSYDGGRFSISINGKDFYNNMCASNDFSVEIK